MIVNCSYLYMKYYQKPMSAQEPLIRNVHNHRESYGVQPGTDIELRWLYLLTHYRRAIP